MSLWKDFKEFAIQGSVIDLAVAVVIGAAFGAVVKSLVDNMLMPPIGLLVGGLDFSQLFLVLKAPPGGNVAGTAADVTRAGGVVLGYGAFVNAIVSFAIIAASVFLLVRTLRSITSRYRTQKQKTTRPCPECLSEIPIAASRCAHCTSIVQAASPPGAGSSS